MKCSECVRNPSNLHTGVDLGFGWVLDALMLDDVIRHLVANQRFHIYPLESHYRARGLQVRRQPQSAKQNAKVRSFRLKIGDLNKNKNKKEYFVHTTKGYAES